MRLQPRRTRHVFVLCLAATAILISGALQVAQLQAPNSFAARIAQLSEPGGSFDTDNLISNEKSYLHVVPALHEARLAGGAYVGVGPDQNFSYIAQTRPSIAFIVDIRRDNLLLHLLFKALFQLSTTRIEYLSLLFGRAPPADLDGWQHAGIERLADYVDRVSSTGQIATAAHARVEAEIRKFGVPLSASDFATIDRFHRTFIDAGLSLKFVTQGRAPRDYYPSYRELLLETDRQRQRWNFLASEEDFQFVRSLQQRDLVIPVVGNLSGRTALAAIGRFMAERGDTLSAFYASNVEFYLFGDGTFSRFVDNLSHLPRTSRSLIIRAVFGGFGPIPQGVPGYGSASTVQQVDDLLDGYAGGRFKNYSELIGASDRVR